MIASQSLEMIPPILGRERTFGWYPPAHEQFAKVPYKSYAVLDDYCMFKVNETVTCKPVEEKVDAETTLEEGGTVLSSKLNAIRQDLARRRIDTSVIRKKYDNINQFWNIPQNWKPKYPEPHFEMIGNALNSHSAPVTKELRSTSSERKVTSSNHYEKKTEEGNDNHLERENKKISVITNVQDKTNANLTNKSWKRPYTAPGELVKYQQGSISSTRSSSNHQLSTGKAFMNQRPSSNKQLSKKHMSVSHTNIPISTYESDLEKYQWMMEVPGDPFCIKQPHIPEKQPYFHKIPDCTILPPELRMSKQNRDTFFYNTLPNQALSFDISPNFTSEKFNAKKNLLRSQGKWNYSSKNFSFVY